jgi:hypothetical protein
MVYVTAYPPQSYYRILPHEYYKRSNGLLSGVRKLITASGQMKGSPTSVSWEALALLRFFLAWIVLSGHLTSYTDHSGWAEALSSFDAKAAVVGFLLVSGYSIAASLDRESEGSTGDASCECIRCIFPPLCLPLPSKHGREAMGNCRRAHSTA